MKNWEEEIDDLRVGFPDWLNEQRQRDNSIGDLARDFVQDAEHRNYFTSSASYQNPDLWHSYLFHSGACPEAHVALDKAWRNTSKGIDPNDSE